MKLHQDENLQTEQDKIEGTKIVEQHANLKAGQEIKLKAEQEVELKAERKAKLKSNDDERTEFTWTVIRTTNKIFNPFSPLFRGHEFSFKTRGVEISF